MVSLLIGHVHANILQAEKVESRMLMTCTWRVSHPLRLVEKIAISKRKRKATKPGFYNSQPSPTISTWFIDLHY